MQWSCQIRSSTYKTTRPTNCATGQNAALSIFFRLFYCTILWNHERIMNLLASADRWNRNQPCVFRHRRRLVHLSTIFRVKQQKWLTGSVTVNEAIEITLSKTLNLFKIEWSFAEKMWPENDPKWTRLCNWLSTGNETLSYPVEM